MAIKDDICELFPVRKELERVMHSDDVMFELHELQKQIYFCAEAEKDNEEIAKEIMPNLMKNNNLRMTRLGIEEKEEDHLQDILHPDADENGYVIYPNVNIITEMTNLIDASRSYEANATAFEASKAIAKQGLTMGQG